MKKDPLQAEKEFMADVVFKHLTGLTRAEDASLGFYALELEKQKTTEEGFKEFAEIFADMFVEKFKKKEDMTEKEKDKLTIDCLKNAWKKYNE